MKITLPPINLYSIGPVKMNQNHGEDPKKSEWRSMSVEEEDEFWEALTELASKLDPEL